MSDPEKQLDETGSGGSSDCDTQADDTAKGTLAEHPTGDKKATANVENDPPA